MAGKVRVVVFWIGVAGLFHYRNSKPVKMFMRIFHEFCQYLGAMFFAFVNAISDPTKELIKIIHAVSPHVVQYLFDTIMALRWFCEQIISGLMGNNSMWLSALSWVFFVSFVYLYISQKLSKNNSDREVEMINRGLGDGNYAREINHRQDWSPGIEDNSLSNVSGGNDEQLSASVLDNSSMDHKLCVICFQAEKNTAIFPCGHAQLCWKCAWEIMRDNSKCPLCKQKILELKKVYM